jgi:hypothetical protein
MNAAAFRDSGWILLGVLLGTLTCVAIAAAPGSTTVDPLPLASVFVFVMLARSAWVPQAVGPIARPKLLR